MKTLWLVVCVPLVAWAAPPPPAVVTPRDNLVVQGVPPVPVALTEKVNRYASFRMATLADWHPTRREMLIVTRFGDAAQVHHLRGPLAARTQLTFGTQPARSEIAWVGEDAFVFASDEGGNEQYQLYRQGLTGTPTLLTDGASRNTSVVVSRSGKLMAYASTRRNGDDVDVWVSSTSDGSTARMLAPLSGGGWLPLAFSPDEKRLVVANEVSVNDTRLFVFDVATGAQTPLAPAKEGEKVAWGERVRFTPDGKSVFATTDSGSEFLQLVRVDLATGTLKALTGHLPFDVDSFDVSRDGKRLVFLTNEKGLSVLRTLDLASGRERKLAAQPGGVMENVLLHANGREAAVSVSSNRLGTDVFSVELVSGKLQRWTQSETGGLDTSTWNEGELVEWKSFDDKLISGFLYRPPPRFTGRRPVVIAIHGGPEGQSRPESLGRWNYVVQELGVALLEPNVRGSLGFGKTFSQLDNGLLREGSYQDIAALLEWIKTREDLDPERVAVVGGSYGGFMTLAVAANYSSSIRCAIDVVGPSNLVTFLEHTSGYRRDLRRVEYGDERDPAVRAFLERIAPANKAKDIKRPLFVIQGANDPRVPASESEQMVATVRKGNTPVWYLLAKDEGHGFAKKANADFSFWAQLLFFQRYLLE